LTAGDLVGFAFAALSRHRRRSVLSVLGMTVGVASVVVLTALGEGARRYVTIQFSSLGSNLLMVLPGKNETTGAFPGVTGVPNDLTLDDARALERGVREALFVAPIVVANETVSHMQHRRQVLVLGATYEYLKARELHVSIGRFLPQQEMDRGAPVVVLGAKAAEELFPNANPLGSVVRIGDSRMRAIGVLERRGQQIGVNIDDIVIIPVASAMRLFNRSSLFRIMLKLRAHADLERAKRRTLEILTERHGEEDVSCITQESVVESLSKILNTLTLAVAGIGAISLSVAGLGVMNLMLVSVSERTQEVGLLKAIGAARRQILALFLTEAVLLAVTGAAVGLALGFVMVRIFVVIYPSFPASTPLWAIVSVVLMALVIGALFGVLPARRATNLDPVAALAGR
jgi:putative ABC transport system permease protein